MGNTCAKADQNASGLDLRKKNQNLSKTTRSSKTTVRQSKQGMPGSMMDTHGERTESVAESLQTSSEALGKGRVTHQMPKGQLQTMTDLEIGGHNSTPLVLQAIQAGKRTPNDNHSDDGGMLNDFNSDFERLSNENDEENKEEDQDKLFGMGNSHEVFNQAKTKFQIVKSRALNTVSEKDYQLSLAKRVSEQPLNNIESEAFQKALFYMYGACEGLNDNTIVAHNLLRGHNIWDGTIANAKKYLSKQIVVLLEDDEEEDLSQIENIIRFLSKHSKFGKTVREIEEIGETLAAKIYKLVSSEGEIAIKIPKKIPDQHEVAFLDIIYQTQLMQFCKQNKGEGHAQYFPSVCEEIFVINKNTRTILNYVTFVEFPQTSLINMLDGPTAGAQITRDPGDEEGYRSQEIFTQEKFAYLYYKGILLLEFLYDNGMSHGDINASSLRISDDYNFTLSEFPISTQTINLTKMSTQQQASAKTQLRGYNKQTSSEELRGKLRDLRDVSEFSVSELIQEDWKDMITAFYFPRLGKMITDPRLRTFIESTNQELFETGQEVAQIKNIAAKAHRFMMSNIWILEDLIGTLKDEQMFEAVDSIGKDILELGNRMDNLRLQVFAQLTLGEIASQEHLQDNEKAEAGIAQLLAANTLYQQDASILSTEEFSRLCLSLSTLYRSYKKDTSQAKRWLELAKDKITDKRVLLTFYIETANILSGENKHYQALDSNKKAMELGKQLYREDDYAMFELQMNLAESYEKCDEKAQAETIFNECFQMMDGRDGTSVYSRGMSVRSKVSQALSIKSRNNSIVMYGRKASSRPKPGTVEEAGKDGAMKRIAVQLRQKQEYNRAEKLMLKAIHVKKQITGSEVSEDIAYLYNELAVTYHGNDDFKNAATCIKKQLAIWDQLKRSNTMEYAQVLCFLGEIYRDLDQRADAIETLGKAIRLHEQVSNNPMDDSPHSSRVSNVGTNQLSLERTGIMRTLAEEQIKHGLVAEGIETAEAALVLQMQFFSNMINSQVQETMLLLGEAYSVHGDAEEALEIFQRILDSHTVGFGALADEPTKDIYRKMAPLHQQMGNFIEAASCLEKVLAEENQEILKVGLLTKIAGNYKKAEKENECLQASKDALALINRLTGEKDAQSCRCLINLAQVYHHFNKTEQAKNLFQEYLTMFNAQNGTQGTQDWTQIDVFCKLRDFAQAAINDIDGVGEEEYYDEEAAADEEAHE